MWIWLCVHFWFKHTYKCNLSVSAPTSSEAPDYIGGTEVRLRLVGTDGKVLLDQSISDHFPIYADLIQD